VANCSKLRAGRPRIVGASSVTQPESPSARRARAWAVARLGGRS